MKMVKVMLGDNIRLLKKLPENSVDSVVTDPPYGLSFMNKKWDYDVPSVEFWTEVLRVLKPGGHVLSFGGTRTYHRMVVNMEDAGFEIRDQIMWLYGSGFPKSHNIANDIDKKNGASNRGKAIPTASSYQACDIDQKNKLTSNKVEKYVSRTKESEGYEGWGTALKPANEPICLARKPLSEKTVAGNVLKWRVGGINVDGCRVGYTDGSHPKDLYGDSYMKSGYGKANGELQSISGNERNGVYVNDEGRFPANIILECICDEVIKGEKGEKTTTETNINNKEANWFRNAGGDKEERWSFNDKGDIHTDPMCPCRLLDEQSGISKSNCKSGVVEGKDANLFNDGEKKTSGHKKKIMVGDYNDKGGASRFFYQAKVNKKERNMGLDDFEEKETKGSIGLHTVGGTPTKDNNRVQKNTHPTVKPVALMSYLCRLITPPGGIVLDPFMGSGSTGIAARLEGFRFCGMEMDAEYMKIAEARIEDYEKYREFLEKK